VSDGPLACPECSRVLSLIRTLFRRHGGLLIMFVVSKPVFISRLIMGLVTLTFVFGCKVGGVSRTNAPAEAGSTGNPEQLPVVGPFSNDANDEELRRQFLTLLAQYKSAGSKDLSLTKKSETFSGSRRPKTLNVKMRYPVAMISKTAGRQGATDLGAPLRAAGGKIRKQLNQSNVVRVEFQEANDDRHMAAVIEFLRRDSRVEIVEPDYRIKLKSMPNDPEFSKLWGLKNSTQGGADINVIPAWERTTGQRNVIVGVIDTGIDCSHPDLAENCWVNPGEDGVDKDGENKRSNGIDDDGNGYVDDWQGWDFWQERNVAFDDNIHGTHVAGTIGAVGNNNLGVVGVNWRVSLVPLKFLDGEGGGYTSDAIEAIDYATKMKFFATNNSWGGGENSELMRAAIERANAAGVHFIAAAGNSASNNDRFPEYPASYDTPNIISVAAIDRNGQFPYFSNYGANSVDVAAPGDGILSTAPNAGYEYLRGTSMATPHVTGVLALLKSAFPDESPAMLRTRLFRGVSPLPTQNLTGRQIRTGGMINVQQSMLWVPDNTPPSVPSDVMIADHDVSNVAPASISATVTFKESGDDGYIGKAQRYVLRFSTSPIQDEAAWASALNLTVDKLETGRSDGRVHAFVRGLPVNTAGWLVVRAYDDDNNESAISAQIRYQGFNLTSKTKYDGSTPVGWPNSWTTENDPVRGQVYSDGVGYYVDSAKKRMTLKEFKIPNGMQRLVLRYWAKHSLEKNYDFGRVRLQGEGGFNTELESMTGHKNWHERTIDLTAIAMGQLAKGKKTLTIHFELEADAYWNYDGWLIDDIEFLVNDSLVTVANLPDPASTASGFNLTINGAAGSLYSSKYFPEAFAGCVDAAYDVKDPQTPINSAVTINQSSAAFGVRSLCIKAKVAGITNLVFANYQWIYENAAALIQATGLPSGRSGLKNVTLQVSPAAGSSAATYSYAFGILYPHLTPEQYCSGDGAIPSWSAYIPISQKPVINVNPNNSSDVMTVALCVRGRAGDGSYQMLPVVYSWIADFEGPTIQLDSVPASKNNLSSVKVSLKANADMSACRAKLVTGVFLACPTFNDGYVDCSEPPRSHAVNLTTDGSYTICLYGLDSLGNTSLSPVSVSWTRDATPPTVTLSGLPVASSASPNLNVGVSGDGATEFQWSLLGPSTDCSQGVYSQFVAINTRITAPVGALGGKRLCVKGRDAVGNVQVVPTTYAWTQVPATAQVLAGLPSSPTSATSLRLKIGGDNIAQYQYALLRSQNSNCVANVRYSAWFGVESEVALPIAANTNGFMTLCILGRSSNNQVQTSPTIHRWLRVPKTTVSTSQQLFMNITQVTKAKSSQTLSFNRIGDHLPAERVAARFCLFRPADGALVRCVDRTVNFRQGIRSTSANFSGISAGAWVAFVVPSSANRGIVDPVIFVH
jgi:subtilisin family serine protease